MKKTVTFLGCILGGIMIGLFANRLDTIYGALLFTFGVILCVSLPVFANYNTKK